MPHKYNAKKTVVDGITFDSKKEAARYLDLKLLERGGMISGLTLQPKFTIADSYRNGAGKAIRAIVYIADFAYITRAGKYVIEDVKGVRTEAYRIKKKLFEKRYAPWTITEI